MSADTGSVTADDNNIGVVAAWATLVDTLSLSLAWEPETTGEDGVAGVAGVCGAVADALRATAAQLALTAVGGEAAPDILFRFVVDNLDKMWTIQCCRDPTSR